MRPALARPCLLAQKTKTPPSHRWHGRSCWQWQRHAIYCCPLCSPRPGYIYKTLQLVLVSGYNGTTHNRGRHHTHQIAWPVPLDRPSRQQGQTVANCCWTLDGGPCLPCRVCHGCYAELGTPTRNTPAGRVTTSACAACLGFYESRSARLLGVTCRASLGNIDGATADAAHSSLAVFVNMPSTSSAFS